MSPWAVSFCSQFQRTDIVRALSGQTLPGIRREPEAGYRADFGLLTSQLDSLARPRLKPVETQMDDTEARLKTLALKKIRFEGL